MRRLIVGVLAAGVLGAMVPAAHADERVCRGTIGKRTLDNVKVPQGATCTLKGTKVKGNIVINRDAVLEAIGVHVVGNVQGENAKNVIVRRGSVVGGDIQVVQGRRARVVNSRVGGDILYDEQRGRVVVRGSRIDEDVQAFQSSGGVVIKGNRIGGNLQCKENSPRPTGGGNTVGGNKEDQCRRL